MIFLLPMGVNYRAERYPVVTFTLMGLCSVILLITVSCEAFGNDDEVRLWTYQHLWLIPSQCHWWTFLTSQFVHGGILHLVGNMIYLFLFGSCVEDIIGRVRFTIFYLACGVIAAFSHILLSADHFASSIPMGGASGAISGCIGGFLLLLARSKINFRWFALIFFRFYGGEFMMPAWIVICVWFCKDAVLMALTLASGEQGGGVAFGAHVGGTLAGIALIAIEKTTRKKIGDEEQETEAARRIIETGTKAQPVVTTVEPATIHLSWGGTNQGPYSASQIRLMFRRGEIPANAFYWQEGMDEWRAADELREPGF